MNKFWNEFKENKNKPQNEINKAMHDMKEEFNEQFKLIFWKRKAQLIK